MPQPAKSCVYVDNITSISSLFPNQQGGSREGEGKLGLLQRWGRALEALFLMLGTGHGEPLAFVWAALGDWEDAESRGWDRAGLAMEILYLLSPPDPFLQ